MTQEYGVIITRVKSDDCLGHNESGGESYETLRFGPEHPELNEDIKYFKEEGRKILDKLPKIKSLTIKVNRK